MPIALNTLDHDTIVNFITSLGFKKIFEADRSNPDLTALDKTACDSGSANASISRSAIFHYDLLQNTGFLDFIYIEYYWVCYIYDNSNNVCGTGTPPNNSLVDVKIIGKKNLGNNTVSKKLYEKLYDSSKINFCEVDPTGTNNTCDISNSRHKFDILPILFGNGVYYIDTSQSFPNLQLIDPQTYDLLHLEIDLGASYQTSGTFNWNSYLAFGFNRIELYRRDVLSDITNLALVLSLLQLLKI